MSHVGLVMTKLMSNDQVQPFLSVTILSHHFTMIDI